MEMTDIECRDGSRRIVCQDCLAKRVDELEAFNRCRGADGELLLGGVGINHCRAEIVYFIKAHLWADGDGVAPGAGGDAVAVAEAADAELVALGIGQGDGGRSGRTFKYSGIIPVGFLWDIGQFVAYVISLACP